MNAASTLQHGIYVYIMYDICYVCMYVMYVRMYLCVYVVNIIYERCKHSRSRHAQVQHGTYVYIMYVRMYLCVYVVCVCVCVCDDTHSVTTRKEETIPSFFFPPLPAVFFSHLPVFFFPQVQNGGKEETIPSTSKREWLLLSADSDHLKARPDAGAATAREVRKERERERALLGNNVHAGASRAQPGDRPCVPYVGTI